jgi:hypothetical protein
MACSAAFGDDPEFGKYGNRLLHIIYPVNQDTILIADMPATRDSNSRKSKLFQQLHSAN